jgi:hypothetical protein
MFPPDVAIIKFVVVEKGREESRRHFLNITIGGCITQQE